MRTPKEIATQAYKLLETRGRAADPALGDVATAIDDTMRALSIDNFDLEVEAAKHLIRTRKWKRIGLDAMETAISSSRRVAAGRRISEGEIAEVVVEILKDMPDHTATYAELVAAIPHRVALSLADMVRSPTRPTELVWEQQLRNIVAHKSHAGNAVFEGRLRVTRGGFALPKTVRKTGTNF